MRLRQPDAKLLVAIDMVRERDPATANLIERRATVSTDRKIPGSRLRRPGKGRTGARIQFFDALRPQWSGEFWMVRSLFDHKNAETYRTVQDVRDWLFKRAQYVKTQARRQ